MLSRRLQAWPEGTGGQQALRGPRRGAPSPEALRSCLGLPASQGLPQTCLWALRALRLPRALAKPLPQPPSLQQQLTSLQESLCQCVAHVRASPANRSSPGGSLREALRERLRGLLVAAGLSSSHSVEALQAWMVLGAVMTLHLYLLQPRRSSPEKALMTGTACWVELPGMLALHMHQSAPLTYLESPYKFCAHAK